MAKKANEFERIVDTSPTHEPIEAGEISQSLGAKANDRAISRVGSPFSFWALRSKLLSDLVSTGGRPGRKEAVARKKVPMTESEWALLDEITRVLNMRGVKASAGQVAGILLNQSMTEVLKRLDRVAPKSGSDPRQQLSETELEEKVETILAAAASAQVHLQQLRPVALELLRRMSSNDDSEGDDE